jgi:hypothetical protein
MQEAGAPAEFGKFHRRRNQQTAQSVSVLGRQAGLSGESLEVYG